MSFVDQILSQPGVEPQPRPKPPLPAPVPPEPRPPENTGDEDFGEEFGHAVKKDGAAGGAGFEHDEYDRSCERVNWPVVQTATV